MGCDENFRKMMRDLAALTFGVGARKCPGKEVIQTLVHESLDINKEQERARQTAVGKRYSQGRHHSEGRGYSQSA